MKKKPDVDRVIAALKALLAALEEDRRGEEWKRGG